MKTLEAKRIFAADMRRAPTPPEAALWERLRKKQLGVVFHRQALVSGFILDFYCGALKVAIEIDGSVHSLQYLADARREDALRQRGIVVLRFANRAVLDFGADVARQILTVIDSLNSEGGDTASHPTRRTEQQPASSKTGASAP